MDYQEITNLYRQLGRAFHDLGAEKVILAGSKTSPSADCDMELSVVISGCQDSDVFHKYALKAWPEIKVNISKKEDMSLTDWDICVEDGVIL